MSKLAIGKFKDGAILKPSQKKQGWYSIMAVAVTFATVAGGLFRQSKRLGFFRAEKADLMALGLINEAGEATCQEGEDLNQYLSKVGAPALKIVRKESTTPFYEGQQAKQNPETKEFITDANGNPIYMEDQLVAEHSDEVDVLIPSGASVEAAAEAGDDA